MTAVQSTWQAGFMTVLPTVREHARIQFRGLPAHKREDAIQEAIASACASYQRLAAKGQLHAARGSMLAKYAVNFVRSGRHVGGRQDSPKDVMSPACQKRRGIRVFSADPHPGGDATDGWKQIAIEDRRVPIPDLAAFRIDFACWLRILTRRDRHIIAAFICGERTMAVAERFAISEGRVSQLRRRYEREWAVFQKQAA